MIFINKPHIFSNLKLLKKYEIGKYYIFKIKIIECMYKVCVFAYYRGIINSLFDKQKDFDTIKKLKKMYEYDFVKKKWEGHYDKIKKLIKVCPYCEYGEIWEIDHFLPKSIYPEFSVFFLNLVPSCHICNSKKSNKNNICIHPYLEYIKDIDKMLWAEFKLENESLIFYYHKQKNIPAIVEKHIDTFDILNRYKEKASVYISDRIIYYKSFKGDLLDNIKLEYTASKCIYLKVMYRAILDDFDNFKDCLEKINYNGINDNY